VVVTPPGAAGSAAIQVTVGAQTATAAFTYTSTPTPEPELVLPPPWFKSFARLLPDAPCPEGWHPSYAQWPFGGTGGYVCNQTMRWSTALNAWYTVPGFS
jgi:hypothetical protein